LVYGNWDGKRWRKKKTWQFLDAGRQDAGGTRKKNELAGLNRLRKKSEECNG